VVVADTTEISFPGPGAGRRGLGPGGDGKSPGFFIHPVVAVDAESEAVLGVVGARIWTRGPEPVAHRRSRPVEAKESRRWTEGAQMAAERLAAAAQVVVVGDQEADIFSHFARCPPGVELRLCSLVSVAPIAPRWRRSNVPASREVQSPPV
jgi:hypothetical protein